MSNLSNVYDFYFPSPPPLADLACIQIGLDLWRQEINAHRTSDNELRERDPRKNTTLAHIFPNLPSPILSMIQPYAQKIGPSIGYWLERHARLKILGFEFLNKFCDFAIDFDSNIHYVRTAQRIMNCDSVSDEIKFKIACWYCLENDIVRLWPSVMQQMSSISVDFNTHPQLHYWLNKMQDIATDDFQPNVESCVLDALYGSFHYSYWSAVKYFWKKLDLTEQRQSMMNLFHYSETERSTRLETFIRHVLAKLDEEELRMCVDKFGDRMISSSPAPYIMRIWFYIKNTMTETSFCRLFKTILTSSKIFTMSSEWCEGWTTAPHHLKRPVVAEIVSNVPLFRKFASSHSRFFESSAVFILSIVSEASLQDRNIFWQNHSNYLIGRFAPRHLRTLIDLCFSDEVQKNQFKKEFISSHPTVMNRCFEFLLCGHMVELEEELALWCPRPDQQTTETFEFCDRNSHKLRCTNISDVRLHLLHEDFVAHYNAIGEADLLSQFIDKAFNKSELASAFKDQLLVAPNHTMKIMESLKMNISFKRFSVVMKFVDLFASSEEIAHQVKENYIIPDLRGKLRTHIYFEGTWREHFEEFENFIPWLLGSNERILEFKNTLYIHKILDELFQIQNNPKITEIPTILGVDFDWFYRCFGNPRPNYYSSLAKFLKWYFVTTESLEEFKRKHSLDGVLSQI